MSRIFSLSPIVFTITIRPRPDGTAQVETRVDPPMTDMLALCQAMLGVMTEYIAKVQQVQERNEMLVKQKSEEDDEA